MPIGQVIGRALNLQDALDFIEQFDRRAAVAIQFVDEGHDGRSRADGRRP